MILAVSIVKRGIGEKIIQYYQKKGITFNIGLTGKGTATSEMLDLLGIGESEKDIVISTMKKEEARTIIRKAEKNFRLKKLGEGLIFTVPINSVGGEITYKIISGLVGKEVIANG